MNLLIVGGGGREHALAWKLAQSPRAKNIFCAPGNAGTEAIATNIDLAVTDISGLVSFAQENEIGLVVVGPDDALAAGMADAFLAAGIRVFGPTREAAQLESSKSFAKDFMRRHGIPAADSREFEVSAEAQAWCRSATYPLVVKADGLALGKGVVIATSPEEANHAISQAMDARIFGDAGRKVVVEEYLEGRECSIHALVDQSGVCIFPDARDHKQVFDGNRGPNTGGMGTVSPAGLDRETVSRVQEEIVNRFFAGLQADGLVFRGMLFPGLMLTREGPKDLEFNCRFGDPETQVLLRRLKSDLLDLLLACTEDRVGRENPDWDPDSAACVVLASGGYPQSYQKGHPIHGLETVSSMPGVEVFHAGTKRSGSQVVTSGGRVLGVTATGKNLTEARSRTYAAADGIHFDGLHRREDIGQ